MAKNKHSSAVSLRIGKIEGREGDKSETMNMTYLLDVIRESSKNHSVFIGHSMHSVSDDRRGFQIMTKIQEGFHFNEFDIYFHSFDIADNTWTKIFGINKRTFDRKRAENTSFNKLQSGLIVELISLFTYGEEVFESRDKFTLWMEKENKALGGKKPFDLIDNSYGINLVFAELNRIDYGVIA